MTILWLVDRFGLPGQYHRVWVKLMRDNYIPTNELRVISLHKLLNRQLLQKHGTRKAPTWVPDEGPAITAAIDQLIRQFKPRAVVLTAPEALACLGLHPDHATLHALRGSVYWRSGVPHIVMLPMSAWFSLVSQKEIGAANYGFESAETFAAARQQGEIPPETPTGGTAIAGVGSQPATGGGRVGVQPSLPTGRPSVSAATADSDERATAVKRSVASGPVESGTRSTDATRNSMAKIFNHLRPVSGDSGSAGTGVLATGEGAGLDSGSAYDDNLSRPDDWSVGDGGDDEDSGDDSGSGVYLDPAGSASQTGDEGLGDDGPDGSEDDSDSVSDDDGGSDEELSSDSEADTTELREVNDPDAGDVDQFFYEPILSPVGRFVLTADTQKLFRILRDGKNAAGPSRPIEVNWR